MKRRQVELLKYIEECGEATLSDIAKTIPDYSSMTLWRDLKQLGDNGRIIRVHGGARAVGQAKPSENNLMFSAGTYDDRVTRNTSLKKAIAIEAAKYIQPGKPLFFDSGSTIMALVEALSPQSYIIVTHGVNIAIALSQKCDGCIYVVGGEINSATLSCSGQIAKAALAEFNIDTAFMTASGYEENCGFSTSNMAEQAIKREVIKKAVRVILLLDSSKFGKIFPFSFAQLENIDVLVTDKMLPEQLANELTGSGKEIVIA